MTKYGFLVFFRFEKLSDEDAKKSKEQWEQMKREMPKSIKLVGEYYHAWGTRYNGFLLFECENADDFVKYWKEFKDKTRWYLAETRTILSKKV